MLADVLHPSRYLSVESTLRKEKPVNLVLVSMMVLDIGALAKASSNCLRQGYKMRGKLVYLVNLINIY